MLENKIMAKHEKTCKTHMKFVVLPLLLLPTLASCITNYASKRTNPIVPGEYWGDDEYSDKGEFSIYLKIEEIDESSFNEADGINVMQDEVGGGYYSIVLTFTDSSGTETQYNWINIRDYSDTHDFPVSYLDDNRTWLTPMTSINRDVLPYEKCSYSVHVTGEKTDYEFYSYLYPEGYSS